MSVTVSNPSDKSAPTSGPWQVINDHVYAAWSTIAPFTAVDGTRHPEYRNGLIALVYGTLLQDAPDATRGDISANARLIAAAPELLAACRNYIAWLDCSPDRECVAAIAEQMRAAIASADGRA